MGDRELLELAAKAAGLKVRWHESGHYGPTMEIMESEAGGAPWNPLTDDGDALRLLVAIGQQKPGIELRISNGISCCLLNYSSHYDDAAKATRRAIVLAAAEIGRGMP